MVYFVLALWLFRGRNCGYGQVMAKLADGLYHQRRGADLVAGQLDPGGWADAGEGRRWKQPNISSLSRGRGKLGPDPVRMLFEQVAGPTGADGAPGGSAAGSLDLACCYPDRRGCETVIGHHKADMGEGQPVLRSKDPGHGSASRTL
jgi:hypothetical protein